MEKLRVHLAIDSPIRLLSYPEDAVTILENGEKLARDLGETRGLASFCSSLSFYHTMQGEPAEALECTERAFESARQLQDPGLTAILAFDLCVAYNLAGQCWKLAETASQAIDLIEKTQSQNSLPKGAFNMDYYSALYSYCGVALAYQGDFGEARRMCEKGLRLASEGNNRYSMAFAHAMFGYLCLLEGDWSGSVSHFENSIRYQQEIGAVIILGITSSALGLAYAYEGNLEMAQSETRNAMILSREHGLALSSAQYPLYEGMIHLHSGNLESARECCERSYNLAKQTAQPINLPISMIVLGSAIGRADKGRFAEAVDTMSQGIKMCDELRLRPYSAQGHLFLAELYAEAGQMDKSVECLTKARSMFQDMGMEYWITREQRFRDSLPVVVSPNAVSKLSA